MTRSHLIGGIDDATKCPCIGSIFIAGVAASKATIQKWKIIGVTDSKVLTKARREQLARVIRSSAAAYVIDEIRPEMMADLSLNLNGWEMLVVLSIISRLPVNVTEVRIDNWEVSKQRFFQRLDSVLNGPPAKVSSFNLDAARLRSLKLMPEHHADEIYTVVGAASILAKESSDAQYCYYRKRYGDFGSGSPADPKTRLYVWQHRLNPNPIIRTTWQTFKNLCKLERIEEDKICGRVRYKTNGRGERI